MYQVLELISQIIYFFNRFFFISIGTLMAVIELVCIQVEVVEAGVMGSALFLCLLLFWYFYQELKIQIQEKPRKPHSPHPPNYCGYHKEDEDWRYLLMVVYCMRIFQEFQELTRQMNSSEQKCSTAFSYFHIALPLIFSAPLSFLIPYFCNERSSSYWNLSYLCLLTKAFIFNVTILF